MRFTGKKVFAVFFLFFIFIVGLVFYFLTEPDTPAENPVGTIDVGGDFGNENIRRLPVPDFSTSDISVNPATGRRDDRVYSGAPPLTVSPTAPPSLTLPPDGTAPPDGAVPERSETPSRLTRIFVGPTAGYRIDNDEDEGWVVRVMEQGRGDRYSIRTAPYALDLVSTGEFTGVFEGHLFSNSTVLALYEKPGDESSFSSAFVSFAPTDTDTVQIFEDDIRATTDGETGVFFIKKVGEEVLGIVVDVENPEETTVVWRSHFKNWIPRWGRGSGIILSAPISPFTRGYVYLIDPDGEDPTTRLVDIPSGGSAFVDTSSGFFVLYESSKRSLVGTTTVTDQMRKTSITMPSTLPEKCDGFNGIFICAVPHTVPAFTRSGYETMFPDSWYQGDIVLRDALIQIDAVTGEKKLLMASDQEDIRILSGGKDFDIIHPQISGDGRFLFFVDKNDLSLWMLRL